MRFRVLGPLEVADGGSAVDLGGRKQQMVLALLLVHVNQVVSVDRLIELLWGDDPPARSIGTLQVYVSNLRRAIEPSRAVRAPARILVTQAPGYVMRVAADELDASRFEALAAEGRRLLAAGQAAAADRTLTEAVSLWRGPALPDFASDPFFYAGTSRLEELRLGALEDRLEAELALGRHAGAVAELEALATEWPLRERVWGLLMVALYRSGRQAEALRAFAKARSTLAEEIGVDPGSTLRGLEAEILAQSPSLDWRPADDAAPDAEAEAESDTGPGPAPSEGGDQADERRRHARPTLVGRHEPMATLEAALLGAGSRRGGIVLVSGEAGAGKTRLVEELTDRAVARGMAVAWGRCFEAETAAFWPWVEVVRSLVTQYPADVVRAGLGRGASVIAQIIPEIKDVVDDLDPPMAVDPDEARLRLYDALTACLGRLAEHNPVFLVIDDLQWADAPSLRLLQFLAMRIPPMGVLVAATHREGEGEGSLAETLAELARQPAVSRVPLGALAPDDVAVLLAEALGGDRGPSLVTGLHQRTRGNAFFVVELLALLAGERELAADPETLLHRAIPTGVRDVVRRRLARLSREANGLLKTAAAVGGDFELEVLNGAGVAADDGSALDLLEEALVSALVVEVAGEPGRFRFSHDLVRETIYDEMSSMRRAHRHRCVGEALEAMGRVDGADAAATAYQFWQGIPAGSGDKAITYALRAAEHEMTSLGHEHAERHLRRALAILDGRPAGTVRARQELLVRERLSLLLLMTRGYADSEAGEVATRSMELCRQLDDDTGFVVSTWRLLSFHVLRSEYARARELALSLLHGGRDAAAAPLFALVGEQALGAITFSLGELTQARRHLESAVGLADHWEGLEVFGEFEVHPASFTRDHLALDLWLLGEPARAEEVMQDALALARRLDDPFSIAFTLFYAAVLAVFDGDGTRALQQAEACLGVATKHGFGLLRAMASSLQAWGESERGDVKQAVRSLKAALSRTAAAGATQWRHFFLALLAQALWRDGRLRSAVAVLDAAVAQSAQVGDCFYEPEVHRLRGEILFALAPGSRAEEALASLERAVSVAHAQGAVPLESQARASLERLRAVTR